MPHPSGPSKGLERSWGRLGDGRAAGSAAAPVADQGGAGMGRQGLVTPPQLIAFLHRSQWRSQAGGGEWDQPGSPQRRWAGAWGAAGGRDAPIPAATGGCP